MSRKIETKNLSLIYDLLIADGSATAMGLAAIIGGGAALGALGVLALSRLQDYFSGRERDLQDQLEQVRQVRADLDADNDNGKAVGAHGIYR
jgi:hypothetical protein